MLPARFPSSTARPAPLRQHQCPDRPSAPARHAPAGTPGLTWLALLLCVGWSRVALAEDLPTNATARADDAAASANASTNEPDESTTPASPGPQITTPPPAPARLLVSGGSAGELARLDCGRSGEDLTLAAFAAASARLERAQTAFVMDSGGLLGPHPLTRYAESDAPDGLVALLRALHYRALALDHQSLARLQHPPQRRLLAALQTGGIDLLAHNLRCPEDAAGVQRCQGLQHAGVPLRLHPVGNQMLTVIGVVEPDAVETLPAGLALTPAAGAIAEATRQARAQGAHLVVASYDPGPAADAGGRALSLANGLPEDGRPDLLLIAGRKTPLLFARPRSVAPALSSSSIGGVIEITLRAPQTEQVADITARPEPGAGTPAESLARWKKTTTRSLCNSLVGTLAGGKLTSALDRATLSELAARVVRSRAGVDAALLPEGSLSPHFNGAVPPALRPVDLQLAFPDPVPLVQTRISGKDLLALAGALPEGTTLAGVTRGSKAKVAGQPIEAGAAAESHRIVRKQR